jgi:hypothetical protein
MAYYGDRLEPLTLDRPLRASGKVCLRRGVSDSTVLVGFFHARDSMRVNPSQRSGLPQDFLGVAIDGPSREGFYFAPAYRVHGDGRGQAAGKGSPYVYCESRRWMSDMCCLLVNVSSVGVQRMIPRHPGRTSGVTDAAGGPPHRYCRP